MGNPGLRSLNNREKQIDELMASTGSLDGELRRSLRIEKTILIAAFAIVEAIWKARE